jgi:hypothetical protein
MNLEAPIGIGRLAGLRLAELALLSAIWSLTNTPS